MLEEPLCDDEYEYYTDEDEADIEDEASVEHAEDDDCWYLLAQDEDDTLKSSNSVPDVPGPVRKDSAWRRKFDEAAMDTLLMNMMTIMMALILPLIIWLWSKYWRLYSGI